MIFKTLFTNNNNKKWQSEKISDRVQAISELDPSHPQHKKILHELAYNDGSASVRWPALEKLQEFSLFWQSYKQDPEPTIRKKSETKLAYFIFESTDISDSDKQAFVTQSAPPSLLDKWLDFILDGQGNESLVISMLQRIDKDSSTTKVLQNRDLSDASVTALIDHLNDSKALKKLTKHKSPVLAQSASKRLKQIQEAAEKPAKIEQQTRLLLARLKALKEQSDFELFSKNLNSIITEWQGLQTDIKVLSQPQLDSVTEKYQTLLTTAERQLEFLQKQHQQILDQKAQAQQIQKEQERIASLISSVEAELINRTNIIAQTLDQDISDTFNQFSLAKEYSESALTEVFNAIKVAEGIEHSSSELKIKANTLKLNWVEFVDHSTTLLEIRECIETLKTVELYSDSWNTAIDLLSNGKRTLLNNRFGKVALNELLPDDFEQLQALAKKYKKQQSETSQTIARRLKDVHKQINLGRFNDAIRQFTKLEATYNSLDTEAKAKLQANWANTQDEITKLLDLRATINEPKIAELIQAAQELAQQPLANLDEQAHRIKTLRKNWNSLRLEETSHQEQQVLFDELLEKAFEPCRLVYQARESQRHQNYQQKQNIIVQLNECFEQMKRNNVADWKQLEQVFSKLQSDWSVIGPVDREKQSRQQDEYYTVCKDIKALISAEHLANKEAKQALLERTKAIVNDAAVSQSEKQGDQLNTAAQQLKSLQKQWKAIGYAGKHDSKLWQSFRRENDRFFEQRSARFSERQKLSSDARTTLMSFFEQLQKQISEATTFVELKDFEDKVNAAELSEEVLLPKDLKEAKARKNHLEQQIRLGFETIRQLESKQKTEELFELVLDLINNKQPNLDVLSGGWRNALIEASKKSTNTSDTITSDSNDISAELTESRAGLTLLLEAICQVDSPIELKEQRGSVNLYVLSQKLEQGIEFNKDMLLTKWLAVEPWTSDDMGYVERVKPLFEQTI
ncbi:DUF349 domain-containing protein [Psychrosphaera ytuae]|uniref:DUF349 domain-containing protein n=1 Tax=Psychrosphaera ytuae TaxID=2820710 RepID=A0A975HIL9_9GAMM|nr:DUF349 domain-containing protein [Psychrosphaera ytuae]QTH64362.1 DUF349 domain-containing protein [Psychrosphaera ytuae]